MCLFQDEVFQVLSGRMGFVLGGEESIQSKGETVLVPVKVEHTFWNADPDKELHITVTLKPQYRNPYIPVTSCPRWIYPSRLIPE